MPLILSLAQVNSSEGEWALAAGPEGLFRVDGDQLVPITQPQTHLYCCAAAGGRIFVGGLPHGIAYSDDAGASWHAAHLDGVDAPAVCLAHASRAPGVLLAGTSCDGVLRSTDNGTSWTVCNLGLQSLEVLALAWVQPTEPSTFPAWDTVFAATNEGVYRSPNGGRGWRRCIDDTQEVFQALAVSRQWQQGGASLAGSESSGLFFSLDKGHHFARVAQAPEQVDALAFVEGGWLMTNDMGLWYAVDIFHWVLVDQATPALALMLMGDSVIAGGTFGLKRFDLDELVKRAGFVKKAE